MAAELSDVIAEGTGPGGVQWLLRAGGTESDFYTMLETRQANGRVDSGGMGGPMLPADSVMNVYYGTSGQGFLRVVARTNMTVHTLRLRTADKDEPIDLTSIGTNDKYPIKFFVAILPDTLHIASIEAFGKNGSTLGKRNTERQSSRMRKFLEKNTSREHTAADVHVVTSSEWELEDFLRLKGLLKKSTSPWKPTLGEVQAELSMPDSVAITARSDDVIHGFEMIQTSRGPQNTTTYVRHIVIENNTNGKDAGISILKNAIQVALHSSDTSVEAWVEQSDPLIGEVLAGADFSKVTGGVYRHTLT
jgi:hypothetical protein